MLKVLQIALKRVLGFVAVGFAVVAAILGLLMHKFMPEMSIWGQLRLIVAVSTTLHVLLALPQVWRRVWRLVPILNEILFPDLNGTWDVAIHWQRADAEDTVPATAVFKQSLFKLSIELTSDRTHSETLCVVPKKDPESDRPRLLYLYRATPIAGFQENNPPHQGAATLIIEPGDRDKLQGNYFTDRASKGHFVMTRQTR